MKSLLILMAVSMCSQANEAELYLEAAIGYKIQEPTYALIDNKRHDVDFGNKDTFTAEIGINYQSFADLGFITCPAYPKGGRSMTSLNTHRLPFSSAFGLAC